MTGNPFVDFMRTYGPCASSDSMYDEHVHSALRKYGVDPIELSAHLVEHLGKLLAGPTPTNVILTGTAGDGKTYHIRRVFHEYLGGDECDWPGRDLVITSPRPDGRKIRIIRDLSELPQEAKQIEINHIARCLIGDDTKNIYLIAANDGQLLEMLRTASHQSESPSYIASVYNALVNMMQAEEETDPTSLLQVHVYNLSRMTQPCIIEEAIDTMLKHPMWDTGCESCPLGDHVSQCAIRINRSLLLGNTRNGRGNHFRSRLRDLLELATANDQHIPIRQILTLIVNIVLGDARDHDDPLLTCERAMKYTKKRKFNYTNPYDNAIGQNLAADVRSRFVVFSTLEMFGIGFETTNGFDDLLLHQRPRSVMQLLESADPTYGLAIFRVLRNSYVNGLSGKMPINEFIRALVSQRRRLFFELPYSHPDLRESHWMLTIFHRGQHYLDYRAALKKGNSSTLIEQMERQLVKGLNRALTGMMTEETEKLWLASMIGKSDDPTGRISIIPEIDRSPRRGIVYLDVRYNASRAWPELNLAFQFPVNGLREVPGFEIRPQIFEFLLRVADGSLPSSFSRQCHQEVKHFAMILCQFLQQLYPTREAADSVRVLSLDADALIKESQIKVIHHDQV